MVGANTVYDREVFPSTVSSKLVRIKASRNMDREDESSSLEDVLSSFTIVASVPLAVVLVCALVRPSIDDNNRIKTVRYVMVINELVWRPLFSWLFSKKAAAVIVEITIVEEDGSTKHEKDAKTFCVC